MLELVGVGSCNLACNQLDDDEQRRRRCISLLQSASDCALCVRQALVYAFAIARCARSISPQVPTTTCCKLPRKIELPLPVSKIARLSKLLRQSCLCRSLSLSPTALCSDAHDDTHVATRSSISILFARHPFCLERVQLFGEIAIYFQTLTPTCCIVSKRGKKILTKNRKIAAGSTRRETNKLIKLRGASASASRHTTGQTVK